MKLIVGLGNPGEEYVRTLHNVGFRVVEALAEALAPEAAWTAWSPHSLACRLPGTDVTLLKPSTFMNGSGRSAQELMSYFKTEPKDLWVVHDDLDLPPGMVRISFDSASAGHRGVQSIIDALGTKAFWRFRIGIGRPPERVAPEDYVLMADPEAIEADIRNGLTEALARLRTALERGTPQATTANTKDTPV